MRLVLIRFFVLLGLFFSAFGSADTSINLAAGWNLVGNSGPTMVDVAAKFGDPSKFVSVWKWNKSTLRWAMYAPSLAEADLAAYTQSKGYELLTSIGPKDGFWVNASSANTVIFTEPITPPPTPGEPWMSLLEADLQWGWNLMASADNKTPSQLNAGLGSGLNAAGKSLVTAWAWDAPKKIWRFYAPSLEMQGGSVLSDYIASKSYAQFDTAIAPSDGFWINVGKLPVGVNDLRQFTPAQFAATAFKVEITGASVVNKPTVSFKVMDGYGKPLIGLGSTSKTSTALVASYPNIAFSIAKLVPGKTTTITVGGVSRSVIGPSKWVSYMVTTVPTVANPVVAGSKPSTDANGTLVDNGDGTYKYTFYRDISQVKAQVAALVMSGANDPAALGDLTYDPSLIHRVSMVISGNAPGTGTNTPNGVQAVAGVPISKPVNIIYDFIPATGNAVAPTDAGQRLIVDVASCNECHTKLGGIPGTESAMFHGGSRQDPKYCVVCHTDQRKYGYANVTSTNNAFPALTKTVFTNGSVSYSPSTYLADGVTLGDFPVLIHRVHKGEMLVKQNYNYAGILFNKTRYPQDIRNCTKCHDNTVPKLAPQADNYKNLPSRLACGACHDGINFADGTGTTNNKKSTGHQGGAQSDDSLCAVCHKPDGIVAAHVPISPPNPANALLVAGGNANTNAAWIAPNLQNLPEGAITIGYEIKSVSRNASKQPVMVFKMRQNGVGVVFNDPAVKTEIWDNFMGAPSVYFVFAVPQDGIAKPADFNASASSYLKTLWNGKATGTAAGTLTGPDAEGYYTATLTGVTIPDNAVMLTGGMGYSYNVTSALPLTQTNLPRFPITASAVMPGLSSGGLVVVAEDVVKVATGYSARRAIVADTKCNACHQQLGVFTQASFHGGQRNDGASCSWCHTPNRASSGWSADSASFVHAIHAGGKRTQPFTWHAVTTTSSYANIGYPAILSNCETCHITGTADFSASASASAFPNRLFKTVASGTLNNSSTATELARFSMSPYIPKDATTAYGAGFSFNAATGVSTEAAGTTLVNSPVSSACFSCHDSAQAKSHMEVNGGSLYAPRSATTAANPSAAPEQCMLCHGTGRIADIYVMHAK